MCGIVGYAGRRDALPILLDGLKRLEYRGYDSAGVGSVGRPPRVRKDKGLSATRGAPLPPLKGSAGFAHTRWATHGAPSKVNAYPHVDCTGKIALAHNGIIENYASLREKLEARGHKFVSQTDTESLVHLIESYYDGDLETATRKALADIRGSYAILAVHADEPGKVIGARNESPLVVGIGPDENFLASDVPALLRYTDRVAYVMDREMVVITPKGVTIKDFEGHVVKREPQRITWSLEDAEKGGFEHFMLKEIHEAPQYVLSNAHEIRALAQKYGAEAKDMFYIGRHANYPVAMEGALKMKEISCIHAEAYAAGELKHGPLALLTSSTPVIAVVAQDPTYEKMRSNVGEVSARGSPVLAIGTEGDKELPKFVDDVIEIPSLPWIFSPVPVSVALQLFAYEAARIRNCPIDKPRNLAKSVTVE